MSFNVDQCFAPDSNATLVFLELLKLNVSKIKPQCVIYIDHNTMQNGPMNMDDHIFLQDCAKKYGIILSKAGNGISHQVHLERYAKPGIIALGADSHSSTMGAIGALGLCCGSLDLALTMSNGSYSIIMPKIIKVNLTGKLKKYSSAKDLALHLVYKMAINKHGNYVLEFTGDSLSSLNVYERATIANMSAEMGVVGSIFPSDEQTKKYLEAHGRADDYLAQEADSDAQYDYEYEIDLGQISPLAACPSRIDNVKSVEEIQGLKVNQVLIGSCANGSIYDFIYAANVLKKYPLNKDVSLAIIPGSRHTLALMIKLGILDIFVQAGARILESACGACMGLGQAPMTGGVSLRTFNRNYVGRSGTIMSDVYIVSPEVAISSAVNGYLSPPVSLTNELKIQNIALPLNDALIVNEKEDVELKLGPNIKPIAHFEPVGFNIKASVMLVCGSDITTDQIMPSSPSILPYRSNIEKLCDYAFYDLDSDFVKRCRENKGGIIMAGANYGLGSASEHGVIALRYLGIKAVVAKSFSYLHKRNLINFGIIPIEAYISGNIYDEIHITIDDGECLIENVTASSFFKTKLEITNEEWDIIKRGGIL
ncbi:MAG: aconitate hydratase [Acholeplasmatales bacterium]|nr:aconitate hydratase [Acholeplasmatales bacterium]